MVDRKKVDLTAGEWRVICDLPDDLSDFGHVRRKYEVKILELVDKICEQEEEIDHLASQNASEYSADMARLKVLQWVRIELENLIDNIEERMEKRTVRKLRMRKSNVK